MKFLKSWNFVILEIFEILIFEMSEIIEICYIFGTLEIFQFLIFDIFEYSEFFEIIEFF